MKTHKVRPILIEIKDYVEQYPFLGLNNNKLSLYTNKNPSNFNVIPQELILIFLEDEKIEVDELCFDYETNKIIKAKWVNPHNCKKVIARQSQIPPEYISKFIEQYNNDYVEDLEIEMEDKFGYCNKCNAYQFASYLICNYPFCGGRVIQKTEPKLTNGFVTIVEKEAISYTEEEVLNLIFKYSNDLLDRTDPFLDAFENESATNFTKEWFKENKKIIKVKYYE